MMGAMNLALYDQMFIAYFFNHQKCYLGQTYDSFMSCMFDFLSVVTGTEGQFISQATVKKTSLRVISNHMLATQLDTR